MNFGAGINLKCDIQKPREGYIITKEGGDEHLKHHRRVRISILHYHMCTISWVYCILLCKT